MQRICFQFASQIGNKRFTCIADLGTNPYLSAWTDMKGVVVLSVLAEISPPVACDASAHEAMGSNSRSRALEMSSVTNPWVNAELMCENFCCMGTSWGFAVNVNGNERNA